MKKLFLFSILFIMTLSVNAQSIDHKALLKRTDSTTQFFDTDFTADYTIVQDIPGQGQNSRNAIIYRRDSINSYTIIINAPVKDKGKAYLQQDSTLWFFDPADKQFTFTNAKDKFQDTNANTSDFAPQYYSRDFAIKSSTEVKLGSFSCILFELEAIVDNVDYPKIKLWVTENDGLIRKKEDYSLSGQLLRTTAIPSYQKVNGKSVPVNMLIVDNLRGKKINGKIQNEKTQISIKNVSFAKQDDAVYTKAYIEMISK